MLKPFQSKNADAISALVAKAYGRRFEADLIQTLREDQDMAVEFVVEAGAVPVGYIGFAKHVAPQQWWSLCVVAVDAAHRSKGYGSQLVRHGLEAARKESVCAITVLGHAAFYRRFGFTRSAARRLDTPFSLDNTLLYPIRPELEGYRGDLTYPRAFFAN